jgi:hypothetical protein
MNINEILLLHDDHRFPVGQWDKTPSDTIGIEGSAIIDAAPSRAASSPSSRRHEASRRTRSAFVQDFLRDLRD